MILNTVPIIFRTTQNTLLIELTFIYFRKFQHFLLIILSWYQEGEQDEAQEIIQGPLDYVSVSHWCNP